LIFEALYCRGHESAFEFEGLEIAAELVGVLLEALGMRQECMKVAESGKAIQGPEEEAET
jgi:hypothetical protein